MFHRAVTLLLVATAVGCGGATAPGGGDASGGTGGSGAGGSGNSGGSGGSGGTSASHTSSTVASSSATGTFGSSVTSVTNSVTTTTGGTPDCSGIDCAAPNCPDGELIIPPGECCPVCSCTGRECEPLDCPSGNVVMPPDSCCPQCADASCEGVVCEGPTECESGRAFARPDGACCAACIPGRTGSACVEIACPDLECPSGYVTGDQVGGCCYECLPDPLYCVDSDDCVMADRPRECCGCAEAISTRALEDDPCWTPVGQPWDIPEECYPDVVCDALCGACPEPGEAACVDNRCTQVYPL